MTNDELKVGDTVWWTDVNRKGIHTGTVSKVGRKLVTVGRDLVFRKDTGRTNDNYGHQSLIADIDAYKDRKEASAIFLQIRNTGLTHGVSAADARAAAKLLRVELKDQS